MTELGTRLERFLESLPAESGFVYSARERLALNDLFLALFERGELPTEPEEFKGLVAPVVCGSREQQAEFGRRFDGWAWVDVLPPLPKVPVVKQPRRWVWRAAGAAALVGLAVWLFRPADTLELTPHWPGLPVTLSGKVVSGFDKAVGGVEVWSGGQVTMTASDGTFTFNAASLERSQLVLAYHPDYGARVSTLGTGGVVRMYPLGSNAQDQQVTQISRGVLPVAVEAGSVRVISPRGDLMAVVTNDQVLVFDLSSGKLQRSLLTSGLPQTTQVVAFNESGTKLVVAGGAYVADFANGKNFALPNTGLGSVSLVAISPNGKYVAAAGGRAHAVFALTPDPTGPVLSGSSASVNALAFNSDGTRLAVSGKDFVVDEDTLSGKPSTPFRRPSQAVAFCADDSLAIADGSKVQCIGGSVTSGVLTAEGPITSLSVSKDQRWLLTNGVRPQVFDLRTTDAQLPLGTKPGSQGSFTTDGRLLVLETEPGPKRRTPWWRYAVPVVPMVLWAAWWVWLRIRDARLRKYQLPLDQDTKAFRAAEAPAPFRGPEMRTLAHRMRQRRAVPAQDVAMTPTVNATFRRGGFLTPVYKQRTRTREFLVLLQKSTTLDQQARLFHELFDTMQRDHHIFLDLYGFQGAPRVPRRLGTGQPVSLGDLAALHANHDLWIVGDPATFLDSFTLRMPTWMAEFSRWQDRAVLSPVAVDDRVREQLEELGFRVVAASPKGMEELLGSEYGAGLGPGRYPAPLSDLPNQWLEQTPPTELEQAALSSELRRFLGPEGLELLTACAVYPELNWPLTLWLAEQLCEAGRRDAVLARVTALPWFRHGRMPEWLRAELVARLTGKADVRVREAVDRFLQGSGEAGGDLRFALSRLETPETPGRKLKDYVMLEFLAGRKPDWRAAVRAPGWLRRLVREKPPWRLGVAAAGLAVAAWFGSAGAVGKPADQLVLTQYRLPGATPVVTKEAPLSLPEDAMQRAVVLVAESQRPEALAAGGVKLAVGATFVDRVMGAANGFARGASGVPVPVQIAVAGPGRVVGADVIEAAGLLVGEGGRVAGVLPKGPYLDYSVAVTGAASVGAGLVTGQTRVNPKDGLTYVWIPPGTFMMGCSPGDGECYENEKPAHPVTLTKGFWLGQTTVTVEAYQRFATATKREMPAGQGTAKMPVVNVSWEDSKAYCDWMGGRLPTEAEWEYGARGGTTGARYGKLDDIAWYDANSGDKLHEVGLKTPNAYGLYDMLGNAWQWVDGWYGFYPKGALTDPKGPEKGSNRALRGGSWFDVARVARCSYRGGYVASVRLFCVGFRGVWE